MELEQAQKLAQEIIEQILPYCERVEVAGSIRCKKSEVRDVDLSTLYFYRTSTLLASQMS